MAKVRDGDMPGIDARVLGRITSGLQADPPWLKADRLIATYGNISTAEETFMHDLSDGAATVSQQLPPNNSQNK